MSQTQEAAGSAERGPSTKRVEVVVAAILLFLGVVVTYESQQLGAGWTTDGPGSGYFPFLIGLVLIVSSVGIMYQAINQKGADKVFVTHGQLKLVMSVLGPAVLYVLGVEVLGIYVASALYIALFMRILGHYAWFKSVVIGVAVNVFLFCLFEIWFKVPLHKGALEPLAFLGY